MILRQRSTARQLDDFLTALYRSITGVILGIAFSILCLQTLTNIVRQVPLQLEDIAITILFGILLTIVIRRTLLYLAANCAVLCLVYGLFAFTTPLALLGLAAVVLISSAFIANRYIFALTLFAVILRTLIAELPNISVEYNFYLSLFPYIGALIVLTILLRLFRNRLLIFIENSRRTSELLTGGLRISEQLSQLTKSDTLATDAANLIRQELGFYHVQIFQNQEQGNETRLVGASGDAAMSAFRGGYTLPISARNLIGRALLAGEPMVARDLTNRTEYTFADRLPETRAELVVPILEGERIMGALDLHSTRSESFFREEVQALELIASQLGTTLRNARLLTQQEQSVKENRRLLVDSENSLREVERLNRQLTRQSWDEYLQARRVVTGVTFTNNDFKPGAEWTIPMNQAVTRRRIVNQIMEDGKRLIALPIELRGEVVGAIEIETEDNAFHSETLDLLRTLSERLAISLDNARLFEETQEITAQEQRINEIVLGYQSASSIEDLLQLTLEGLSEALGAEQGAIRLGNLLPADANTNGGNHA